MGRRQAARPAGLVRLLVATDHPDDAYLTRLTTVIVTSPHVA